MASNHSRPKSNMEFLKPTDPSKYSLRQKKIERMSTNQVAAVVKRAEELEDENRKLKAEMETLRARLKEQNEDVILAKKVSVADKSTQFSLENVVVSDKEVQVSVVDIIAIFDKAVQCSIEVADTSKKDLEVAELQVVCYNLVYDYLPWLKVVDEPKDYYYLEKQLLFDNNLQTEMVIMWESKIDPGV